MNLVDLLLFLMASAGLTAILTVSSITKPFRDLIERLSSFLGELVHCPMCTGFWVGLVMGMFSPIGPLYGALSSSFFSWASVQIVDALSNIGDYFVSNSEAEEE